MKKEKLYWLLFLCFTCKGKDNFLTNQAKLFSYRKRKKISPEEAEDKISQIINNITNNATFSPKNLTEKIALFRFLYEKYIQSPNDNKTMNLFLQAEYNLFIHNIKNKIVLTEFLFKEDYLLLDACLDQIENSFSEKKTILNSINVPKENKKYVYKLSELQKKFLLYRISCKQKFERKSCATPQSKKSIRSIKPIKPIKPIKSTESTKLTKPNKPIESESIESMVSTKSMDSKSKKSKKVSSDKKNIVHSSTPYGYWLLCFSSIFFFSFCAYSIYQEIVFQEKKEKIFKKRKKRRKKSKKKR